MFFLFSFSWSFFVACNIWLRTIFSKSFSKTRSRWLSLLLPRKCDLHNQVSSKSIFIGDIFDPYTYWVFSNKYWEKTVIFALRSSNEREYRENTNKKMNLGNSRLYNGRNFSATIKFSVKKWGGSGIPFLVYRKRKHC